MRSSLFASKLEEEAREQGVEMDDLIEDGMVRSLCWSSTKSLQLLSIFIGRDLW